MRSLIAYRHAILFSIVVGLCASLYLLRLFHLQTINLQADTMKEVIIALLGLQGSMIGFLLTIVSIFATSSSSAINALRPTIHYKNLIGITLLVCLVMLAHCLFGVMLLTTGVYDVSFYAALIIGFLFSPITLMLRLFYIYYLILSQ